jgi:IclR family KDG regulon transcriptional repressor
MVIDNIQIRPVGPNTVKDKEALLKELDKTRREGYAVSAGERLRFAFSLSVAIQNHSCPVALSVLGPENRFRPIMQDVVAAMRESGAKISKEVSQMNCPAA